PASAGRPAARRPPDAARRTGGARPVTHHPIARLAPAPIALLLGLAPLIATTSRPTAGDESAPAEPHRSPIALALSADGSRLLTANQTADSVSLVDPAAGTVLAEV